MKEVGGIKQRLKEFADNQGISIREFERKCSLGNSFVNHIGQTIGADKLERIIQEYPQLNKDWILYGTGSMFREDVVQAINADFQSNFDKVCTLIQKKDEQIDRLLDLLEVQKKESKKEIVKGVG